MENYYDEIVNEIKQLIEEKKYDEAKILTDKELGMPYVPSDAENELIRLRRDIMYGLSEKKERSEASIESMLAGLKKDEKSQLASASLLGSRNLRECTEEIREYLSDEPCPEAAALIIEAIAEQEIGEEFVLLRNGVEYTFWGDDVTPVAKSEGFLGADAVLRELLGNDHPDMYAMARTLLIHEIYLFLPLSYEREEATDLALEIIRQVSELMDEGKTYQEALAVINSRS